MKKVFKFDSTQERYNMKDQIMNDAISGINEINKDAIEKQD